jgi:hypothetical protein
MQSFTLDFALRSRDSDGYGLLARVLAGALFLGDVLLG